MGLTTSKEELNPLNYPAIWISEPTFWSDFQTTQFPANPPLAVEPNLWHDFANDMNTLVKKINQYLAWMYLFYLIALTMCLLIGIGGSILWVQILTFPVIFVNLAGHVYLVKRNQRLDNEIAQLVQQYETRFLPHNIQLEYITKWTQFCKPRHQRAMRVVLFGPVPNQDIPNPPSDNIAREGDAV